MATRSGGGSNVGLIVTLVGFVLLSVIVSVLAYMGFDGQAKLKTERDKAVSDLKNMEKRRNWYRFQAHLLRSYIGEPVSKKEDLDRVNNERRQFESGSLADAEGEDVEEVKKLRDKLSAAMPWKENSDAPNTTYEQRLRDKDAELARLAKAADDLGREKAAAEEARATAETKQASAEKLQKDFKTSNDQDTTAFRDLAADLNKRVDTNLTGSKERDAARAAQTATEGEKTKLEKQMKALQGRLDAANRDLLAARNELEDTRQRLAALAERTGIDPRVMTAELLDASAMRILNNWDRNWQIAAIDPKGTTPYINLGSSDGLKPQVTFSVHSVKADGKLNPTPKATVEVIRIMGAKQAQVRITSIKDAKADPIVKGDRLFNPTWDPARKKRVALAGLADLGDGTDGTEDLKRLLARQSVLIDAYVDTTDEKAPRTIAGQKKDGKDVPGEVTSNTDYLILADNMDQVRHPRANNAAYKKAFDDQVKKLKEQAQANGVPVIALRKYLDMIGYRPSKVTESGTGR